MELRHSPACIACKFAIARRARHPEIALDTRAPSVSHPQIA
jgi:hypothetical protein